MPELHLRQSEFTSSSPKPFQGIQKFKEIGDLNHIYKNELHKAILFIMQDMPIVKI